MSDIECIKKLKQAIQLVKNINSKLDQLAIKHELQMKRVLK